MEFYYLSNRDEGLDIKIKQELFLKRKLHSK